MHTFKSSFERENYIVGPPIVSVTGINFLQITMVIAKKFVLVKHFEGAPKESDLSLVEEDLLDINDGEYLVEAEYLSVDPYMRPYSAQFPVGHTMIGSQVAKIIESKNPKFPVGKRVLGYFGWRTHTVCNPDIAPSNEMLAAYPPQLLPDFGNLPGSYALGALGMPGNTAYFGFYEICKPKKGETVVVSGAAGAVGSHVGQIAKIHGMKVIGIAGSDAKCEWITKELGFDHAINYKSQDVAATLKSVAPEGVDCYFDNVGGDISAAVIYQMRRFGRIAVCGSISSYNDPMDAMPKSTILQPAMIFNQLNMEGFLVTRWKDDYLDGITKNLTWIREGKLVCKETITEGFENMFKAFAGLFHGENTGKAIVKV